MPSQTHTAHEVETPSATVDLDITGMTCASCAARIEKKLNPMPGVSYSVNYATEKARVTTTGGAHTQDLIDTVAATGYSSAVPVPPARSDIPGEPHQTGLPEPA